MIKTENLQKYFRTEEVETRALRGVNIQVSDGEFVAIMGPSGCGKSTLLNILGLLDNPTSGTYHLQGTDVTALSEDDRTRLRRGVIGFVFQSFNLIDELNVRENIELPLLYMGVPAAERAPRIEEAMERMGISHRAHHYPHQLSGGQQQRVAIARAVVTRPQIILADEPTGNLDSANGREVMGLLRQLNEGGTTVVMVTHSMRDASYATRTINLFDGSIEGAVDVTYTEAVRPTEILAVDVDDDGKFEAYEYLSMCYLLAGTESSTHEMAFAFTDEKGTVIDLNAGLTFVPIQRNWRTNIVGQILTGEIFVNVKIDPSYDDETIHAGGLYYNFSGVTEIKDKEFAFNSVDVEAIFSSATNESMTLENVTFSGTIWQIAIGDYLDGGKITGVQFENHLKNVRAENMVVANAINNVGLLDYMSVCLSTTAYSREQLP